MRKTWAKPCWRGQFFLVSQLEQVILGFMGLPFVFESKCEWRGCNSVKPIVISNHAGTGSLFICSSNGFCNQRAPFEVCQHE